MSSSRARPPATHIRGAVVATVLALVAVACSGGNSTLDEAIEQVSGASSTTTTTAPDSAADDTTDGEDRPPLADPDPDDTPLPVDSDLRIGTLANGLTYYLRSNDAPGSNLELRLVVDAGSLQEPEPGRGIAHFLEHMLFNGTERYPGNDLDRVLRELGAEIGPDFNAFTSYDETVYSLTVTTFERDAVETAFDVIEDWAHAATIDPQAVIDERGVVREELRERVETGGGFIIDRFDQIYTEGTIYSGFEPIGTAESIEAMEAADLRAFYEAWYRPDNMAVVAVGDLPLDTLEDLVTDRFDDLEPRGPAGTRPEFSDRTNDASTHVFTHPDEANAYLSLDIPVPGWDEGTVGGERLTLMENVIALMIQNRLSDAYRRGDLAQETDPNFFPFDWTRRLRFNGTNLEGDDLAAGLTSFMSELLTIEAVGFTPDDVDRAVETFRADLDFLLDSAGTIQDAEFASQYVAHFLDGADVSAISDSVARGSDLLDSFTPAELSDHFRWQMRQGSPIVIAVGPDEAAVPTTAELDAALAAATAGSQAAGVEAIDELMATPDAVDPVETNSVSQVDGTEWIFANGARVVFVQSDIAEGTVDLWASSSGGWSLLEPGDAPVSQLATSAVNGSGLAEFDRAQLDRFLAGSTVFVQPYIDEADEGFVGGGSAADLVTLFQLLHLAITEPRVDDVALEQARNEGENTIALAESEPFFQTFLALLDARFGADPWQVVVPTEDQLDDLTAEAALAIYESRLGDVDDLVVAVVGDVDPDVIEVLASRYVGTLPAGPPDSFADVSPPPPAGILTREVLLDDDVTAAGLLIYHETEMTVTPAVEVTARVLETIINSRLFLSIREDLGASYGGSVSITPVTAPDERVESVIDASGDPDRLDEIRDAALGALADLASTGPTAAELDQALAVVGNDFGFISNFDILDLLIRRGTNGETDLPWQDVRFRELDRVDAAAIRDLATVMYPADRRIEIARTVG